MSWRYFLLTTAALALVGTITAQLPSTNVVVDRPAVGAQLRELNRLSRVAYERQDEGSIRILTDSIVDALVPVGPASTVLKDRLFELERQHRATNDVGITESSLARGINGFLERIGAPAFAQTSTLQLRMFRTSLHFLAMPDLIAPALASPVAAAESGHPSLVDRIPPDIGPAEATILIATILRGKLLSPEMQMPPDEWSKRVLAKKERMWLNRSAASLGSQDQAGETTPARAGNPSLVGFQLTPEGAALREHLNAFAESVKTLGSLHQELERFIEGSRNE